MTILIFIAVLSLLVLVNEIGHFVAAKKSGCEVEEFGIGFPPRVFSFRRGGTLYTINLLPLGGFVKIKGENGDENPDEKSFATKSYAWKSLIVSAGVLMNIALAYVLISVNLALGVPAIIGEDENFGRFARLQDQRVAIVEILDESPAKQAGLKSGDIVREIDGARPENIDAVLAHFNKEMPQAANVLIQRGDEKLTVEVTPQYLESIGRNGIGVGLSESATLSYPWYVAWFYGIERTGMLLWLIVTSFAGLIGQLLSGGSVAADVAGPVGIAVLTGEAARLGITHLLQFMAVLSLNLAIINILPFPALDGSRLLMLTIEQLRGRKFNVKIEQWLHIIGFSLLMLLMIVVTAKDINRYKEGIWRSISNLVS
jgi:regulator of sigma E protease